MSRWWAGEALAPGSGPGRADLAVAAGGEPGGGVRAGQPLPAGQGQAEVPRHPQDIGLAAVLEELPQLRAAAVDLVAAEEIEADAVRERLGGNADGELSFGAELQ